LFISEWDRRYNWLQTTAKHDVVRSMWGGDHGDLFSCVHL